MKRNKMGIYAANGRNPNIEEMLRLGADNYTCIYEARGMEQARAIRNSYPDALILIRHYLANWPAHDPIEWADYIASKYEEYSGITRHVTFANEQNLEAEGAGDTKEWYEAINEWNKAVILRLRAKCPAMVIHAPAFAYGHRDDEDLEGWGWTGYEICRECIEMCDILNHHPYWKPGGEDIFSKWYGLRFTLAHEFFPDMPIFIDEAGNFAPDDSDFGDQIERYVRKLYEYPYILGVTFFIWADPTGANVVNSWQRARDLGSLVTRLQEAGFPKVEPGEVPKEPEEEALVNGDFEGGFHMVGAPEMVVAYGWEPWWDTSKPTDVPDPDEPGYNRRPEFKPDRERPPSGTCQKFFNTYATHNAGLYQQVASPPDRKVTFRAKAYIWSSQYDDLAESREPGEYKISIGIDPFGGTDALADTLVWSEPKEIYDQWTELSVSTVAQADKITVFLRGRCRWRVKNNNSYWDQCRLTIEPKEEKPWLIKLYEKLVALMRKIARFLPWGKISSTGVGDGIQSLLPVKFGGKQVGHRNSTAPSK